MSNRAWVTLATNDSYGLGALVLANSLRRASSAHPAVVLITPSVTEAMRDRLSAVFAEVVTVDVLDSRDAAHLALLQRPELGITFTKIHCWGLTQYDKCVFLDADTLIIQNCDELFEREELSAAPDVGWPDCFNSGVFVYKPSQETFEQLIKFAQERGSFDGGDQGLLNSFFSDWARGDINKHLPFLYNVTSAAFYSYLPALKHYGQNLKIIHFIGAAKPWLQKFNWESRSVDAPEHLREFLQLWWDLFVGQVHPQLDESMVEVQEGPPALPPHDVHMSQHYTPALDPESEFPWHHPDVQIQEDLQRPEIDLSQFHDPWELYGGQIPSQNEDSTPRNPFAGRADDHEGMKQYAWEYQSPHEEYKPSPTQEFNQHYNQSEQTHHTEHSYQEKSHFHHTGHQWESNLQHNHGYDQSSHSQHHHLPHEHSNNWHNEQKTDQANQHHHANDHNEAHHSQTHYHQGHQNTHCHYSNNIQLHDVPQHLHSEFQDTHDNFHHHNLSVTDLNSHKHSDTNLSTRIVHHVHVHHDNVLNHHHDKVNPEENAFEVMNGDISENESDYHEEITPRHPYDGFYLRHRAVIDPRGRKLCTHEIPPTPTTSPSPPLDFQLEDETLSTPEDTDHVEDQSGVAGNLARVVPGASGTQREALDELTRRQGWEAGNIDYMGADSFDKIWAKISQTLSQPRTSPPKQPSPPKEPAPVEVAQEATTVDAAPEVVAPAPTPVESAPVETPKALTETPQAKTPVIETAIVEVPAKVAEAPATVAHAPAPVPEVPAQVVEAPAQVALAPAHVAEAPAQVAEEPVQVAKEPARIAEASKPAPAASALVAPENVSAVLETAAETKAPAEVTAAEIPVTVEATVEKEVPTTVEACAPGEAPAPVAAPVEATPAPQSEPEKTEKPAPSTPPATPKSSEESTPVTESAPQVEVESQKEASAPVVATPEKPSETSQVSTDSPPLATTPSKEEAPAPAAKSEERRKPAGKLQLRPPSVADPLPTPDSELEDAAALAQSIIASELRTPTVTSPSPAAPTTPTTPAAPSSPALTQDARLSVDEPQVPTPPVGAAVSLAQIGVKPKAKPTTAAQIESSVAEKPTEPSAPSDPPKKKLVKKVVKKEGDAPVPPPRKKEKKPKEK